MDMTKAMIVAAAALGVGVAYLLWNRFIFGGLWLWQQSALYRDGLVGTALVLQKIDRGFSMTVHGSGGPTSYKMYECVLEVTLPDRAPYRTTMTRRLQISNSEMQEGQTVPVRVDPRDDKRVLLDEKATDRVWKAAKANAAAAAEERKRALLDEKRP